YIFRHDGNLWTQDKIIPSMGTANGFFGDAVGISGTKVIVGAPQEENLEGAVYIFENSFFNWSEVARIKAASPGIINQFGRSVDIEGNTAIIGEEGYDLIKNDAGAIHVLERSNGSWQTTQVLTPIRSGAGAKFGYRVSLSGRHIIGGAPQDDEIGIGADSGSATIFVKNNGSWEEKKRLAASDEAASDRFGWSVAISGETAVVGSPLHDEMDSNVGAAYFFACQPNDCYNQLNITGNSPDNFIPEGDYLAAQHIISNAIIDADSMVVFKAGQSITLNSGFTVSAGGQFTATIDACTPPAVIWNDEIALRNHFKEEHSIQYSSEAIELFPNPVEDVCNLNFSLPNREKVSIRIIDQMGKTVLIPLNNQYFQQGKHRVHFSTCSLALGMYFVVVQMKDEQLVKRLVLQR
ncbi:MAG: 3-coathanger stack domain-containing protein, partial [Saprospiraceae bacterium]